MGTDLVGRALPLGHRGQRAADRRHRQRRGGRGRGGRRLRHGAAPGISGSDAASWPAVAAMSTALSTLPGHTTLLSELRQQLLCQLYLSGAVSAATAASAIVDGRRGCLAAARHASAVRQLLSSCLLAAQTGQSASAASASARPTYAAAADGAPPRLRPVDVLGGRWTTPFDDPGVLSVAEHALLLHPAALVCSEAAGDTPSAAACQWAAGRLQPPSPPPASPPRPSRRHRLACCPSTRSPPPREPRPR